MRKSNGFPNRLRASQDIQGVQRQVALPERPKRSAFDLIVAFCAIAGLILGVVNFITQTGCEKRVISDKALLKKEIGEEGIRDDDRVRLGSKNGRTEAETARPALHGRRDALRLIPSNEKVDLGTHVEVVLPK